MDRPDLDPELLARDLENLEVLNRFFGGRAVMRRRLGPLLDTLAPGTPLSILDIGSGAGDLCREVIDACAERELAVRLYSLDRHPQIQEFARRRLSECAPPVRFLRADARRIPLRTGTVDLALCTLALHHFSEDAALDLLREMRRVSRRWTVVSDLSRGRLAYAAVWFITRFTRNPYTRFDGPVSVRRAFTPAELREVAARAGWPGARFYREPWFRMSIVGADPAP